jgi:hypothetical protein
LEEKPPAEPKEPDTLVHRVLGQGSRLLADGITGLIEAITSPKSSHIILLCLFFMIIVNMLIAKKMMSVEKQLGELKGTFPAQQEKLAFHKRHYQRQEEDDLWDWLGRIDPDKPVLNNNIYPNLEGQDPAVWDDALEASKITKDKLERHMVDLNHMILKAEGNLAQISRAVHDQGRKIKETS